MQWNNKKSYTSHPLSLLHLAGLSERDRDIFVQRYWGMEPLKNIAARHRVSEGAVKQNLLRNKKKLRKLLEKEGRL